jgi:hypothetical protein
MSDLFLKCMSQLSLQGPLVTTVLALISKSNYSFPKLVVDKVFQNFHSSVSKGDILAAKLNLRNLAVLSSCGAVALRGPGSLESLLRELLVCVEATRDAQPLTCAQQAAAYLLASTAPYAATILTHSGSSAHESSEIAARCRSVFNRVVKHWKSPFDTMGTNAVFNVNTIDDESSGGPPDCACWDTLWEACNVAESIFAGEAAASATDSVSSSDGAHVNLSTFAYPSCFLRPWVRINEQMNAPFELVVVAPKPSEESAAAEGIQLPLFMYTHM